MRAIGLVGFLFLASAGIAVHGEDSFVPPTPHPAPIDPAANPCQCPQTSHRPITLTAQIFYLEKTGHITLESRETNKWGKSRQYIASDHMFEVFLGKLAEAGAILEQNSVSFVLTDGVESTPTVCSNSSYTPDGKRSFHVELSASVLPPGRSVRTELRITSSIQTASKLNHQMEIETGFDIERGKSVVYRINVPEQVGRGDCEYLVRITQQIQPRDGILLFDRSISRAD